MCGKVCHEHMIIYIHVLFYRVQTLSPIRFDLALFTSTHLANFYLSFWAMVIDSSVFFPQRYTAMRFMPAILTISHPVLAGFLPKTLTAQYDGYIFHFGTDGVAASMPSKNTLSAIFLPIFQVAYDHLPLLSLSL